MINGTAYNGYNLSEEERTLGDVIEVPVIQVATGIFTTFRGFGRITPFGKFKAPMLIRAGNKILNKRNLRFAYRHRYKAAFGGLGLYAASRLFKANKIRQARSYMVKSCPECKYHPNSYYCTRCRKRKQRYRYRM